MINNFSECSFVTKALNAEMYGAVAVVISDNEIDSSVWIDMIGDGTNRELLIEIPVYFLRGRDGLVKSQTFSFFLNLFIVEVKSVSLSSKNVYQVLLLMSLLITHKML